MPFAPTEKVPAVEVFAGDHPGAWADDAHTPELWAWARFRSSRRSWSPRTRRAD